MTSGAGSPRGLPTTETPAIAQPNAAAALSAELRALVVAEAATIGGTAAVHVRTENGVEAGVRADDPMPAASVIKLPLAAAVYAAWESGRLKRTAEDERRLRAAITHSDNPAADALIDCMGMRPVNEWLAEAGYGETRLRHRMLPLRAIADAERTNATSARDMTQMLMEILEGKLVSPAASGELREILLDQTRRTRIPAGVPEGVPVGNKTGTLRGIINDGAFVEPPGGPRYAVAVLVKDAGPDGPTSEAIAALSRKVYRLLTERR